MNAKLPPVPLSRPAFGPEEEAAVLDCLRSGWITSGPRVTEFEKAFARLCGTEEAVATTSCTAALHLALWSLDLQPDDEVITPSLTWVSVPNLAGILGARPVFADVDPDTLCVDPRDIERLITPRTRAIAPVHFAGRAADIKAIRELAQARGIVVVEDAAHAIGGTALGKPVGSHAELVAFSFHPNKNITTGDGGMLTGTDGEKLRKARQLRYHGVSRDTYRKASSTSLPFYDAQVPGVKYVMTDIAAAIGIEQLKKLEGFNATRKRLAGLYLERLRGLSGQLRLPAEETRQGHTHTWHLFVVCVEDREGLRDRVMQAMLDGGIGVGYHYKPAHELAWIRGRGWHRSLPHTERIGRTILSLPLHPGLSEADVDRVSDTLARALRA